MTIESILVLSYVLLVVLCGVFIAAKIGEFIQAKLEERKIQQYKKDYQEWRKTYHGV